MGESSVEGNVERALGVIRWAGNGEAGACVVIPDETTASFVGCSVWHALSSMAHANMSEKRSDFMAGCLVNHTQRRRDCRRTISGHQVPSSSC